MRDSGLLLKSDFGTFFVTRHRRCATLKTSRLRCKGRRQSLDGPWSRCEVVTRSLNQQRAVHREAMMSITDADWDALRASQTTAAEKRTRTTLRELRLKYIGE